MRVLTDDLTHNLAGSVGDEALLAAHHARTGTTALFVKSHAASPRIPPVPRRK
jgi:hypothetical protein